MDAKLIAVLVVLFVAIAVLLYFGFRGDREPPTRRIICPNPNCKYTGPCRQQSRDTVLLVILILLFFPAAILYVLMVPEKMFCPKCGLELGSGR